MADSPPPPPGKADALNVEPAVAIAAAANPIAILCIMMLLHLLGDAPQPFRIKPSAVPIELQRAAVSPGVRLRNPSLAAAGVVACASRLFFRRRKLFEQVRPICERQCRVSRHRRWRCCRSLPQSAGGAFPVRRD